MIIDTKAPCKNCPKRGCGAFHDECEAYKDYTAKQNKLKRGDKNTCLIPSHKRVRCN